jgi:hypothetical protein
MASLSSKHLAHAPLASADRLLNAYLDRYRDAAGATRLTLRAAGFEKPVLVVVTPAQRPADMTPRYTVHWEAEGGGPYPVFDGTLTVESDEDYESFWLSLEGSYAPPLGLVGDVFDAMVGRRVADETARRLLADIVDTIEERVNGEEAEKKRR